MERRRDDAASVATWERRAARYGRQEHWETTAIDAALRIASPRPDERLLDLATGSGLVLRRLAARADRPRAAIGIDRSTGMLAAAGALPPGFSVLEADARDVPLPDGWANIVTCAYLLHLLNANARSAVLAEARRLLAPRSSSRLIVVTLWSPRPAARAALSALAGAWPATCGALRPLDPGADLVRAGFTLARRAVLPRHGYPSLVLGANASTPTC